jgi:hypothetical protein
MVTQKDLAPTDLVRKGEQGKWIPARKVKGLLNCFQRVHGISERIAEAAIKEWVLTHNGDFDWDLDEVKAICLRNLRDGIPKRYLPETEQR